MAPRLLALYFPSSCLFVVLSSQNWAGSLVFKPSALAACQNPLGSFKNILMPKLIPNQIRMCGGREEDGSTSMVSQARSDSDVPLRRDPLLGETSEPFIGFHFHGQECQTANGAVHSLEQCSFSEVEL